jgi:hypothetical protein
MRSFDAYSNTSRALRGSPANRSRSHCAAHFHFTAYMMLKVRPAFVAHLEHAKTLQGRLGS